MHDERSTSRFALRFLLLACIACNVLAAEAPTECAGIPAHRHWTGSIFNPTGMQTGYDRSRCMLDAAVKHRDPKLCARAIERKSLFFDGSAISPNTCRQRVSQQMRNDEIAARSLQPLQRVTRLDLFLNGNGRDIDAVIQTSGGAGVGLWLKLSVQLPSGEERVLRDRLQPMDDAPGELQIWLPIAEVTKVLGSIPGEAIVVRATLARRLTTPDEVAVHSHAPHLPLSSTVTQRVMLATLPRQPLTRP